MGAKLASCPGSHITLLRLCMAHVTIKLMEVNLPAYEVSTTPNMNKKRNHLIYCDCSCWIASVSCEKCGFNPVSRVFFIRGSTSLIEFVFFISFWQKQKILACNGRLLACDQKRKLLIAEILVFRNAEKWYAKICYESDICSTKNRWNSTL